MARTIAEIKAEITAAWMSDTAVQEKYGFEPAAAFDATFSKVSIENILFYVVAACFWTIEKLFDAHKQEVADYIAAMKPHTLSWYIEKAKAYMQGYPLIDGYDIYDTSALTDEQISAAKTVKYAAGSEQNSVVFIKVAKDSGGSPAPLSADEKAGFEAYINEIRDAGVVVEIISEPSDNFAIEIDVYYDAKVMNDTGTRYSDHTTPVQDTIRAFIASLPFNGEYRNASLVDALQRIDGVVIPEIKHVQTKRATGSTWQTLNAYTRPYSGYYTVADENLNINFTPYNG
jgi:hypothetical protein